MQVARVPSIKHVPTVNLDQDDWLDVLPEQASEIPPRLEAPAAFFDQQTRYYYIWCSGVSGRYI